MDGSAGARGDPRGATLTAARGAGIALLASVGFAFARNVAWIAGNAATLAPLSRGAAAPDFRLPRLGGGEVALSDLRGQVVLLGFWATWCEPCRVELPHLDRLQARHAARGLRVLAVNAGEPAATVARFVRDTRLGITVLLDEDGRAGDRYGRRALPLSVAIDRDGRVRAVAAGPRGEKRLEAMLGL